jgi:chromosome segregation ATPase
MDEMQEKIGELLQRSQELCSAHNQIDILSKRLTEQEQQFQHERDQHRLMIRKLERKQTQNAETIRNFEQQVQQLNDDSAQLMRANHDLKAELSETRQHHEKETFMRQQFEQETTQLKEMIALNEQTIQKLRLQVGKLQTANSYSNNELAFHKAENERLAAEVSRLEKGKERAKQQTDKLAQTIQELRLKLDEELSLNQNMSQAFNTVQRDVRKLRDEAEVMTQTIETKTAELDDAQETIRRVLTFPPGFQDVDALHNFIQVKDDEISTLEEEIRNANATIKKCWKRIKRLEEQARNHQREYEQSEQKVVSLKAEMSHAASLLGKFERTNGWQAHRLKLMTVCEKINRNLMNQLAALKAALRGEEDVLSFKTLILLSIMLLRWRKLPGSSRDYVTDSRNFWWVHGTELNVQDMIQSIATLEQELSDGQESNQNLKDSLEQLRREAQALEGKLKEQEVALQNESHRRAQLAEEFETAARTIEAKIDPQVHQDVTEKLARMTSKYDETKKALKQNATENELLQKELLETKQKLTHQMMITRQKERLLDDAKFDLYQAHDGMAHWRQGNTTKTKEILALERRVQNQGRAARLMAVENDVLALENRRITFQMGRGKKGSDSPDHEVVDGRQSPL